MQRTAADDWRPIPGYPGYEISILGEVRSFRCRWPSERTKPHIMEQRRNTAGAWTVHLRKENGQYHYPDVLTLMVKTWFRKPEGMYAYHINGLRDDNRLVNIAFATKSKAASHQLKLYNARRRTVVKMDRRREIVAYFRSAREAGIKEYVSYQSIMDRCNHKIKKPYELTGYNYLWADDIRLEGEVI